MTIDGTSSVKAVLKPDDWPDNVLPFGRPYHLYRLFDTKGRLLYVGITTQAVEARLKQHASTKPWWRRVVNHTAVPLGTRCKDLAEHTERLIILYERPWFNIVHNGKRSRYGWVNHAYRCTRCGEPALCLVADAGGGWWGLCSEHEDDFTDHELFSVSALDVATGETLAEMVGHLSSKSWFNFDRFASFLVQNLNAEAL